MLCCNTVYLLYVQILQTYTRSAANQHCFLTFWNTPCRHAVCQEASLEEQIADMTNDRAGCFVEKTCKYMPMHSDST